jgi:hypothetical protein
LKGRDYLGIVNVEGEDKTKMDLTGKDYEVVGYTDFAQGTL